MKVGLFIPCYVDQFYPSVGVATLDILKGLGCKVEYPLEQTCCGQPMANAGYEQLARGSYEHFVNTFGDFDYIVAPSGSCTYHVRHHYDRIEQSNRVKHVRDNVYDLVEFLHDILDKKDIGAHFPHRVGLHLSCHGLRGLRLGSGSERVMASFSKIKALLNNVSGLELVEPTREDECCGFGGTFAVNEAALSAKMGKDRIMDHLDKDADVLTAGDMSCLMHLDGIIRRHNYPIRVMHIAEILNSK